MLVIQSTYNTLSAISHNRIIQSHLFIETVKIDLVTYMHFTSLDTRNSDLNIL